MISPDVPGRFPRYGKEIQPMTSNPDALDTHDMVLIHRVIRREIGQLPRLIRGAANDPARAKVVAAHAAEMLDFLHHHHHGEDELLYPLLRERVALDAELLDRMDAQHAEVADAVSAVRRELDGWAATAEPAVGEQLAARLDAVLPALLDHLDEEESRLLPIVARHVNKAEWDKLAEHGMSSIPLKRRLVILGHIIEETDDAERARFLLNVPPPARLAYRLLGKRQFARETAVIRG
jgi:hemerythrin-like domain-containing protein